MYKSIKNFSQLELARDIFYDCEKAKDTIIISIQEPPEGNGFIFTPTGRVAEVLTLLYEDIDLMKYPDLDEPYLLKTNTMTWQQAKQIISLVKKYENTQIANIWIHCHAGVSRSGAISSILNRYYFGVGDKDSVINLHNYCMLATLLGLDYNNYFKRNLAKSLSKNKEDINITDLIHITKTMI